ncbi:hypothetical protein TNCV_2897051 [Trichonephila clavipes]|nr:hypothetical protein TNCV_2897051 [Trichonephila clavipes]
MADLLPRNRVVVLLRWCKKQPLSEETPAKSFLVCVRLRQRSLHLLTGLFTHKSLRDASLACSHLRMPRAHQAEFSRRSLAGVGLSESVRCHGPGQALLTNEGVQRQL